MSTGRALLVDFGDLASLVALALETDPARVELWHPRMDALAAPRLRGMIELHRSAYGTAEIVFAEAIAATEPGSLLTETRLLLEAVLDARRRRCTRVIWPRHAGAVEDGKEVRRLGQMAEMVHAVSSLAELDDPAAAPVIAAPVGDLSDVHLADLADDVSSPSRAFWPCETARESSCGRCGGCRRWQAAFEAAGVPWPWAAAALPV